MDRPRTSSDKKDTGKLPKTEENPKRAAAKWLPEIMAKYPHAYTSDSSQLSSSEQRAEREGKNSTENRLPIHPDNRPHSDQYDNRQLREIENSKEKVRKWQGHIAHNQTQDKKHDMAVQDNPLSSLDSSDLSCGHSSQYIPREEWKLLKDQASKSESSDSESMSKVDLKQIYTDWYQGQSSSDSVSSVDDPLNADWQKSIQRETHARMNQGEAGPSRRNPSTIEISSSHDTDSQDVVQQLRNIWHQETRLDRTMHSLPQDTIESDAVEAVNFPSQTPANLLKKYLYKYSGGKADEIKQRKAFNKFYEEAQTISNEMRNNSARLQNTADSADAEKLRSREIITRLKQTLDDIKEIQERRKFDQNYHNRVKTETDRLNTQRELQQKEEDQIRKTFKETCDDLVKDKIDRLHKALEPHQKEEDQKREAFKKICDDLVKNKIYEVNKQLKHNNEKENRRRQKFDRTFNALLEDKTAEDKQTLAIREADRRQKYDQRNRYFLKNELKEELAHRPFVKAEFNRQQKYDQDKQNFLDKAIAEYKQILANEPLVKEELNRQQNYDTWKKSSLNSQLVEYKQRLKPSVEAELARRLAYNEQKGNNSSTQFGDILRAGIHGIEVSDERYEKAFSQLKEHIERIKASEDYRRHRKDTKFGQHST